MMAPMSWSGGTGRSAVRSRATRACCGLAALVALVSGCSQPEPDEQRVAAVVGALPGVVEVDASFTSRSLGNGGDQSIGVTVATPPDPELVEALVRNAPRALREVENAEGYDTFVVTTQRSGQGAAATRSVSSLTWGSAPVPPGLAARWAEAAASTPLDGVRVRVWPQPRTASASVSTNEPLSQSLAWALGTDLVDLDWSLVDHQTTTTPYVRFAPGRPLDVAMVEDWTAIEAALAGGAGQAPPARVVVVEDVEGVRRVRVAMTFPGATGPVSEASHGQIVWPLVDAIHASMPVGHRFDLELGRTERRAQSGDEGDGDLVDSGTGSPDWEAAYRQRYPDAVVSAPPG